MKYVSIDIEMTGLDVETCQILQIGAIIEDTVNVRPIDELPKFNCIVEHEKYSGQPAGLYMNFLTLGILGGLDKPMDSNSRLEYRKKNNIIPVGLVAKSMALWLKSNGFDSDSGRLTITCAGKNFASSDKKFLERLPGWSSAIQIRQRIIDPSCMVVDWKNDETLPSLQTCMTRLGLTGTVRHDALSDALDVIRVIRTATDDYKKANLIKP
jgi:hypothetical protein